MRRGWLALPLVAVMGCGSASRDTSSGPAPTASHRSPAKPDPPAVRTRRVVFRATDGRRVRGRLASAGRGSPALVLVHQVDGGASQWDPWLGTLHRAGFTTLAYDGRGGLDEPSLAREVAGGLRFLAAHRDADPRRLGLIGASVGASTVAYAMSTRAGRLARAAVALSPPDSPVEFTLQDRGRWRPHDVLFVSDRAESSSVTNAFPGPVRSRRLVSPTAGHGVALLPDPTVRAAVLRWLDARVRTR